MLSVLERMGGEVMSEGIVLSLQHFDLCMIDTRRRVRDRKGQTLYKLMVRIHRDGVGMQFPAPETMAALAKQYLGSSYEETERRGVQSFPFFITARVPRLQRERFLAAISRGARLTASA